MKFGFCNPVFILLLHAVFSPAIARAQGFGPVKETATLHRKLPALFHLEGTAVDVKVSTTTPNAKPIADQLIPLLETALQHSDNRVTIESAKPQTLISCVITSYTPPQILSLTRNVRTLQNGKTVDVPEPYRRVLGAVTIAYRAIDVKTKRPLDAAILQAKVDQEYDLSGNKQLGLRDSLTKFGGEIRIFGQRKPAEDARKKAEDQSIPSSTEDVNQLLIRQLVPGVANRIVTTDDSIQVLLARGRLAEASKLGVGGLWPRMLEATMQVPQFPKKEDEAYRLYNAGVAYEAMGYAADTPKQSVKFLDQAATNYGKAIDDRPSEKYFIEPQKRIERALVIMRTIEDRAEHPSLVREIDAAKQDVPPASVEQPAPATKAVAPTPASAIPLPVSPPGDLDVLTNQGIIDLTSSGVNAENVIQEIKDAKKFKFDLSIPAQKLLMQNKVSNDVLAAMRQRMREASAPAGAVTKKK